MSDFENNQDSSSEETFDIKEILRKFTGDWYYFVLSIFICLSDKNSICSMIPLICFSSRS